MHCMNWHIKAHIFVIKYSSIKPQMKQRGHQQNKPNTQISHRKQKYLSFDSGGNLLKRLTKWWFYDCFSMMFRMCCKRLRTNEESADESATRKQMVSHFHIKLYSHKSYEFRVICFRCEAASRGGVNCIKVITMFVTAMTAGDVYSLSIFIPRTNLFKSFHF